MDADRHLSIILRWASFAGMAQSHAAPGGSTRRQSLNWQPFPVDRAAERAHPASALFKLERWRPGASAALVPRADQHGVQGHGGNAKGGRLRRCASARALNLEQHGGRDTLAAL